MRRIRLRRCTGTAATRHLWHHAHQRRVVLVIGFDGQLDHVAVLALGVLLDIHAGQKLDAIQVGETVDTPGGCGLG